MRADPGCWRGPATIVNVDISNKKIHINWRGQLLLVAPEQLRSASQEESAAADVISSESGLLAEKHRAEGGGVPYEDLRGHMPPVWEPLLQGAVAQQELEQADEPHAPAEAPAEEEAGAEPAGLAIMPVKPVIKMMKKRGRPSSRICC